MVQFLPDHVYIPNEYEVTEEDDSKWSYITLTYDYDQLIKKTEYIIFHISKEEYFKIDFKKFQDYCKRNFMRLDEEQYLMPKQTKTELINLMVQFGYTDQTKSSKDKWWKFW